MTRVVVISSFVADGGVGLRAAMSVLSAGGVEVIALPTAILSAHLGHRHIARCPVSAAELASMIAALEADGALAGLDAVVTGYLPTAAHVGVARDAIVRVRRLIPSAIVMVDPIMGDDPGGLYVDEDVAAAIASQLAPIADILTPNRFELARLTGLAVTNIETARAAMAALAAPMIAATSIPAQNDGLATLLSKGAETFAISAPRLSTRAHGTGDVFAALLLLGLLGGMSPQAALERAASGTTLAIRQSGDALDLGLANVDWRDLMQPRAKLT